MSYIPSHCQWVPGAPGKSCFKPLVAASRRPCANPPILAAKAGLVVHGPVVGLRVHLCRSKPETQITVPLVELRFIARNNAALEASKSNGDLGGVGDNPGEWDGVHNLPAKGVGGELAVWGELRKVMVVEKMLRSLCINDVLGILEIYQAV